jgi:PAS domain S-box-containing protein
MYNKLLQRQVQKFFGEEDLPVKYLAFLDTISASYNHYEQDRMMLERSIEISSQEMLELNQSERRANEELKTLFENIEEVFFSIKFPENKLLHISPACEKVFGYSINDFKMQPQLWYEAILEEDKNIINDNYSLLFRGKPFIHEYRIKNKEGSIRWVETKITPTLGIQKTLIRLDGVTSDITKRKKTEERLYSSELKFRSLIENSVDMISMMDINGKFIYASPSITKKLRYTNTELLSMNVSDIIHPDEIDLVRSFMFQALQNPDFPIEYPAIRNKKKDGTYIWVEGTIANFLKVNGINAIVSNFRDISERKDAEQNLLNQNIELTKTNSELDKFVYSVSHDLRAPLCSMLGVVEIAQEDTNEELILEHLQMLKTNIKKLDGFILDILNYSRNSRMEVKKEEINLKELLNEVTQNLKFMGDNNRQIDFKIEINDNAIVHSDKSRLNMIFNNLVSNAIRYQNSQIPNPFVGIKIDTSDTETGIIIQDNGIGIRKELHQKIFDMFYRVSEESVGSGLGLYIVKESVKKLNGNIEVNSEVGKGSTFIIKIPNN